MCWQCGLLQVGPEAEALREALTTADAALVALRSVGVAVPVQAQLPLQAGASGVLTDAADAPAPIAPPVAPAATRVSTISGSAVLLGLGALCVVVAAVVFVSVTWSDLSLAAKAAILLAVTAVVGAVAGLALRKRLRGSAEAFVLLFSILVAVDLLSAHYGGLAGLGGLSSAAVGWTLAGLLVITGVAWALVGARSELRSLVSAQLVAVSGIGGLTALAFQHWPLPDEYVAFLCLPLLVLAAVAARALALRLLAIGAVTIAGVCFVVAGLISLSRLAAADTVKELWLDNGAYGVLICCCVLAAGASLPFAADVARIFAAALALAGVTAVVVRPVWDSGAETVIGVFAAAALALAVLWVLVRGVWGHGARLAAVLPALVATVLVAPSLAVGAAKCLSSALSPWTMSVQSYPETFGFVSEVTPLVAAAVLLVLGAIGWLLLLGRLPSVISSAVIAAVAAVAGLLTSRVSLADIVGALLLLAVLAALAAWWRGNRPAAAVFALSGLAALLAALGSVQLTALASLALCGVLGGFSVVSRQRANSGGFAFLAGLLLALSVAAWTKVAGGDAPVRGLSVVSVSALGAMLAQTRVTRTRPGFRLGIEGAAAVATAIGLVLARPEPLILQVALLVAGVATVVVSLVSTNRRRLSLPGGVLLAAASWVRLVDAKVEVVEAYTLPSALALLGVGAWKLWRQPQLGSVKALLPGLTLAFVPSLLRSLEDPVSWRALILGVSAVGALLLGAHRRWIAPLVAGAVVVGVLAVLNLAPFAFALPRWVLFAGVGAALLVLGMTWEKRLADLRTFGKAMERLA